MKAIMVIFDSLNRHYLPPYGSEGIHAPNFERLAQRSVTFDNCYVGSMPCMPARRELHTGRYNFLHCGWGPLEPFDDSMPKILSSNGIYTHLVSDHYHYWEAGGSTYHTQYDSWEFVRGQEGDPWKGQVQDPEIPETLSNERTGSKLWRQDWINREYMQCEEDQSQYKTFELGMEFIRTNHEQDSWFLQLETFDPHEPFFTQQKYKDLYPHDYDESHFDWPDYVPVRETPEQVAHVQAEYAALVSMCDEHLGKVLDLMDELELWDDTLLIVCTDHGFLLGEHDWWAKVVQPFYNEVAHTPLFIWDPRSKHQGTRCESLVQMIDLPVTLLEYFGVACPEDMQGISLREAIATNAAVRTEALFGLFGGHVNITDGRYVYMRAPATPENQPLYEYTLLPAYMRNLAAVAVLQALQLAEPFSFTKGCRTLKIAGRTGYNHHQFGTLLFDLEADPKQEHPITDPEIEQMMLAHMVRLMQETDAPPEQFERLGLQ